MSIRTMRPLLPRPRPDASVPADGNGAGQGTAGRPAGPLRRLVGRLAVAVLAATFGGICLFPSLLCLSRPTLFYDDVERISELQDYGFVKNLFVPINEHLQPFFQSITGLAWRAAGGRLANLPAALAVAGAVPFALSLALLAVLVHRCLGSWTAGLMAAALFSFGSRSYYETVVWYSASSFQWALVWTILALLAATLAGSTASAGRARRAAWWGLAAIASAIAPACCGVGLLAGPAAALWSLGGDRGRGVWRRQVRAAIPMIGTAAYLALCLAVRYQDHLSAMMEQNPYYPPGLLNVYRAPIDVLLPALVGVENMDRYVPDAVELALCAAGLAAIARCARRSAEPRPPVVGAFLILAGYALIYGSRYLPGDDHWVLKVERYHLFPQFGLTLILAPAAAMAVRRLDRRPAAGLLAATCAALVLLAAHDRTLRCLAAFYRFGDQARTLAALDRLTDLCRERRIPRDAAVRAFDPVRRKWFPINDRSIIRMIPETASGPSPAGDEARPILLAALRPEEREALCGGMDVSPYLRPAGPAADDPATSTPGALRAVFEATREGAATYRASCRGAFLEYHFGPTDAPPRAIRLPVDMTGLRQPLTVTWTDDPRDWSAFRSVTWRAPTGRDPHAAAMLPLDRLPHWKNGRITRIRIIVQEEGVIAVGTPALLR